MDDEELMKLFVRYFEEEKMQFVLHSGRTADLLLIHPKDERIRDPIMRFMSRHFRSPGWQIRELMGVEFEFTSLYTSPGYAILTEKQSIRSTIFPQPPNVHCSLEGRYITIPEKLRSG